MDLNATIDIIIKDLTDIKEILEDLKHYQGVPALEVELAKSKCRSVIDIIALMKNLEQKTVYVKDEQKENIRETVPEIKKQPEQQLKEPVLPGLKVEAVKEVHRETPSEKIKEPEQVVTKLQEHAIIADQFADRPESFNEKLGSMIHDDDVLDLIKTKHVENLTEAIGINDKFLFIREIFNGDQESYDQALIKIDTALSLEDAKATILNYAGENKDNEAFKMFIKILKRKFPSNE
jgi:hypothetical protein